MDSPGHVDFCSEVSSALRLCDGALVIVDVVEGVRTQTVAVLRQAWQEHISPCLVLNKIDRLISELQMDSADAYTHMVRIIEQVNATCATFHQELLMLEGDSMAAASGHSLWEAQDQIRPPLVFSPAKGNVAFASATFNWAFRIDDFAKMVAQRLGMKEEGLRKALWAEDGGDCYFNPKTKAVGRKSENGKLKPMFVQFILDQVWAVHKAVLLEPDQDQARKIVAALKLKVSEKELFNKNSEEALRAVMSRWLPLAACVLQMAVEELPSPVVAQPERMTMLLPSAAPPEASAAQILEQEKSFASCDTAAGTTLAFVSKMFSGDVIGAVAGGNTDTHSFIGFARVFSGTLKVGDTIQVLHPRHEAVEDSQHATSAVVTSLHLMMGRDLLDLDSAPAGCVCGIGGLQEHVLKYATLCSTRICRPLNFMAFQALPIVRVAVEPMNPMQQPELVRGLQLLNQADPSVETRIQESGELVVVASGEMHLERCLKDLRELFAKIDIHVSPPLVQFKETLGPVPAGTQPRAPAMQATPNKLCDFAIRAVQLPEKIRAYMVQNGEAMKTAYAEQVAGKAVSPQTKSLVDGLQECFKAEGWADHWSKVWALGPRHVGPNILLNSIPGFQQKPNWLPLELIRALEAPAAQDSEVKERIRGMEGSIISGFQLCTVAGPLCEEPMEGVAIFIENVQISGTPEEMTTTTETYGPWSGQVISAVKDGCRAAFLEGERRLVEAIFNCEVQTSADMLGKAYAVLNRRRANIVEERMKEGTDIFVVDAKLPVCESFGLVGDLRKQTSGAAQCHLVLAGWTMMESDPFWEPATEEELEDFDGNDVTNARGAAKKWMDIVRKRKGLPVEEKLVEHAEKQRTRAKRK